MTSLIPVVGLLTITLVLLLWYPKQIKTGRLAALYTVDSTRELSSLNPKSLDYKLLASGLNLRPVTFRLLSMSAGVCGMAISWLFLPGLPAMVIGAILVYIPGALLNDRVKSRGRVIDQLLPIAIGRTAAGLLAGGSVPDVLQQVGESLELEKSNPLTPEFVLTASEMRIKDRREALRALAARSPSVSLANLAQLLEGYTESGGRAYSGVLMDISSRVQQILIARNRAQAKAGDSLVSAKVLPVVLIFILIYLGQDPMVRSSLNAFPVQVVIGGTMAAMVAGYFIIRSMIMEAVQMTALITLTGIAVFALVIYLTLELVPAAPTGRLSEILTPADGVVLNGWRKSLSPLDKPVSRWTPAGFLRKTHADLYWAHMGERWRDWNEVQFTSLRVALAVAGFGLAMLATAEPVLALVGGLIGFQYPAMSVGGVARRYRRAFIAQLPEYVQLVSAQMSANVSMEEALRRTAQAQSLVGKWMRWVLQMGQGRDLIEQMQREAQESLLPELIGMSVQLEFIRKGTAQQELMGQLATSIAADYIGSAEQRAEKVGSELVIPMVIFYFLPFLVTLLAVIGWPIIQNLGAM